jgi:predicted enzyme related to lactoylglutathione lyase
MTDMARVTGIGGVFLRARDPKALAAWYARHLNFNLTDYGVSFRWSDEVPKITGLTTWSTFPADTKYFGPSHKDGPQAVMIDYRVDDLDALILQLQADGVSMDRHREDTSYGKFAWIVDLEGNRLELWQPFAHAHAAQD